MEIYKYTYKKYKCEKCKRVCKESKYIYTKNYKVVSNRNVKLNKEKIYKSNKYIEMCIKIYIKKHKKNTKI